MITNYNNPSDKRQYSPNWQRIKCGQLFEEINHRSETGSEELLSVSHITGITPRTKKCNYVSIREFNRLQVMSEGRYCC